MKTNALLPPLIDHDQYVLFCLDEVGHRAIPFLTRKTVFHPGLLCGCEFYTVRWIDHGSRQVFYMIAHMSFASEQIIRQLEVVRQVADPTSITVTAAHRPPDNNERPLKVAAALGIQLSMIRHVHDADPIVMVGELA